MTTFQSKHFTLDEFTKSQIAAREGIDNTPTDFAIENLNLLCLKILDPLREAIKKPVVVSSGYRNELLNKKAGGTNGSQHTQGEAADIYVPGMTARQLFDWILRNTCLPIDQIIDEFEAWVHVSYDKNKTKQRGNKFIAKKVGKKTQYIPV